MAVISLTDALRVTTIEPLSDIEPSNANIDTLHDLGFPAMPDNPDFRAAYGRLIRPLKGKGRYVTPMFHVLGEVGDSLDVVSMGPGRSNSLNWCGGVVQAPGTDAIAIVAGNWVVPAVATLTSQDIRWYSCASWVGIDGTAPSTHSPIRVGVVSFHNNLNAYSQSMFFFHWPPAEFTTGGIVVHPGDWVSVLLLVDPRGGHTAATSLINRTTGDHTHFVFSTPGGPGVDGRTAEWIVSTNTFAGDRLLGDFGQVFFADCTAYDRGGRELQGGTGNSRDMVTSFNSPSLIADGDLIAPTIIRCRHVGNPP